MNTERERGDDVVRRAAIHAALSDPARLRIVDRLSLGDGSPSELAAMLAMPSNLLAHHLRVLEGDGLIRRNRSEGDKRRHYIQLVPAAFDVLTVGRSSSATRVVFVCTANSARSQLAAALWRHASHVPTTSAGTHPAQRIDPGTLATAQRHRLPLRRTKPQPISQVRRFGDLVITVCDMAHEELGEEADVHWSVSDPVPVGSAAAFDGAYDELSRRVSELAPRLHLAS